MASPVPSHYLNQCCLIITWITRNKLQWDLNQNTKLLIHENAFEVVIREMVAICPGKDELIALHWPEKTSFKMAHDDVIKWKHFPRYWPFVWGIHRSPVNSLHKGQWRGALMFCFDLRPNKWLSKQSWGWWFEMLSRPLWRHRNVLRCQEIWWNFPVYGRLSIWCPHHSLIVLPFCWSSNRQ